VGRKRAKPALTQEEQARIDALRLARKVWRKGSGRNTVGLRTPEAMRRARSEARYKARLARMAQERVDLERERALVAAITQTHLARLREGDYECSPWDEEFVQELGDLLCQGLTDRAVAIALAVTTEVVSWRLPDDTLTLRFERAATPLATDAKASRGFTAFVRGQVLPAHQRWAVGAKQKEAARLEAARPSPESDVELERRRQDETLRRRAVAKRY
jgi:hypothetical protein